MSENGFWIFLIAVVLVVGLYGCSREEQLTERAYVQNGYTRKMIGSGWNEHTEWQKP